MSDVIRDQRLIEVKGMCANEHVLHVVLPSLTRELPAIVAGKPADGLFYVPIVERLENGIRSYAMAVVHATVNFCQDDRVNGYFVRTCEQMSDEAERWLSSL
jgi:hypothetical protein